MNKKFLVILAIFMALAFGSWLFYHRFRYEADFTEFPVNPSQGEAEYKKQNRTISIGETGTHSGNLESIADGKIYLAQNGKTSEFTLNEEEIALQCTTQYLSGASQIDLKEVTDIKIYTSETIESVILSGEPIVVFAGDIGGTIKVHTIAIDAAKCQ